MNEGTGAIMGAMELVLLMGIPGSGKSTYYHREYVNTHLRLNLDQLNTNRNREQLLFYAGLAGKAKMAIDNTNLSIAERARYIGPAKAAGYTVQGIWIYTPLEVALERNAQRKGKARLPDKAVGGATSRWQPPTMEEGFDSLTFLDQDFVDRVGLVRIGSSE